MSDSAPSVWLGNGRDIFKGIAIICGVVVATMLLTYLLPIIFDARANDAIFDGGVTRANELLLPVMIPAAIIGAICTAIFFGMKTADINMPNLRGLFRILMYVCVGATVLLMAYLVIFGTGVEPAYGSVLQVKPMAVIPIVVVTLVFMGLAALFTGIYLSDTQGVIEPKPDGFFDIVSLVLSRITMIAVAAIVCVMFYEVISRYIFNKPTLWANELSLWIAGFVFLLAGLYAMQQRSHIRIYIIYDMFPRWMQKIADVISVLLIWTFTTALIWGAFNEARDKVGRMETFGTAWDPPIPSTIKAGILIIIAMVALQALSNLIADWNKAPEHHSPADEIDETEIENIRKSIED